MCQQQQPCHSFLICNAFILISVTYLRATANKTFCSTKNTNSVAKIVSCWTGSEAGMISGGARVEAAELGGGEL